MRWQLSISRTIGLLAVILLIVACSFPATTSQPGWEIKVTEAAQKDELGGPSMIFNPKSDQTFLVASITFHNLKPDTQKGEYSIRDLKVISEAGEASPPYALGVPMGKQLMFGTLDTSTFTVPNNSEEISLLLAFAVKKAAINKPFKVQALDMPPTSFAVK